MSEFTVISIEETDDGIAFAKLKNGDDLSLASNGVARYNGSLFKDYSDIISNVTLETIFDAMAHEIDSLYLTAH